MELSSDRKSGVPGIFARIVAGGARWGWTRERKDEHVLRKIIVGLLVPIRRRLRWQFALRAFGAGMILGALVCVGLVLAERALDRFPGFPAAVGALLAVPVVAGLLGLARRPSWRSTAALVDDRCRLHDRTSAALEFSENACLSNFERLQVDDAVQHLRAIRADDVAPLFLPRESPVAALFLAIAVAVLTWSLFVVPARSGAPGLFETALDRARELEEPARRLEAEAKALQSPALHAIAERMRQTIEELKRPGLDMHQTMAKLSELQTFIAQAQKEYDAEPVDRELQSLGDAMVDARPLEPAGRALQEQQLEQAARALEQARSAAFDSREARAVEPRLKEAAESMKTKGLDRLSRATSRLADGVKGDAEKLKQGTQDLAKEIRDHDRRRRINELMAREQRRLSDCKKYCEARNLIAQKQREEERKRAQGDGPKPEPVPAHGKDDGSNRDQPRETAGERQKITGQAGDGLVETEEAGHSRTGENARSRRPSRKLFQKYERESEAALDHEPIPLGHREAIRRYFELIRPPAADNQQPEGSSGKAGEP
jgi:hypothetical protein